MFSLFPPIGNEVNLGHLGTESRMLPATVGALAWSSKGQVLSTIVLLEITGPPNEILFVSGTGSSRKVPQKR